MSITCLSIVDPSLTLDFPFTLNNEKPFSQLILGLTVKYPAGQ